MDEAGKVTSGGCLCGGMRYEVRGPLRDVWACHCSQCRRSSGNFVAATRCRPEHLTLVAQDTLAWYHSSASAETKCARRCRGSVAPAAASSSWMRRMAPAKSFEPPAQRAE